MVQSIESYIDQEQAKAQRNLDRMTQGLPPEPPSDPPIPGLMVDIPDPQTELDKLPRPEEFIPDEPPEPNQVVSLFW